MSSASFTLKGEKQLIKNLEQFPAKFFKQVVKAANTDAMKPFSQKVKAAYRSAAPKIASDISKSVTGAAQTVAYDSALEEAKALAKSVARVTKVYGRHGNIVTVVGPRYGTIVKGPTGNSRKIQYLNIEFGDPERDIEPNPIMRQNWDQMVGTIERNYAKSLGVGMAKIAARMKK